MKGFAGVKRPPWLGPLVALVIVFVLFVLWTPGTTFLATPNLLTMTKRFQGP